MTNQHLTVTGAIALLSASLCSGGIITTLNPYTFGSSCQGVESLPTAGCSVTDTSGRGTVQYGLNSPTGPFVMASASSALNGGQAYGSLTYEILPTGPTKTVQVDVNYLLSFADSFSPAILPNDDSVDFNTSAVFGLAGLSIDALNGTAQAFGGSVENFFPPSYSAGIVNGNYSGSHQGPQTLTLSTGFVYQVQMRLQANCTVNQKGGGVGCTTSIAIDPTFTIDPNQANAGQYSIAFSPGVGNGSPSAVPEPETVGLFGAGIAALAFWRKRLA